MEKSKNPWESLPVVALLTLSGGFMDAYSYISRGHVFSNAQTGNLLLIGVHLSTGHIAKAVSYAFPVIAFICGIAAAEIIRNRLHDTRFLYWREIVLLAEAAILFATAWLPQGLNLLATSLLSFVCGAQVESFRKVNGSSVATTMCIGNLRAAVEALCSYFFAKDQDAGRNGLIYLGVITIFVLGAVLGNVFIIFWHEKAILLSAALLVAAAIFASRLRK